jgi:hypothetical protein
MQTSPVPWTSDVQAIASVVGFVVIIYQIRQLKRAVQSDTHSKLYSHYLEVTKLWLQKPQLRPYFYEGKTLDESAPNYQDMRREIDVMCEVILGLLEHAVLQKTNLPGDSWKNCWKAYAEERYTCSPDLSKFFSVNRNWYAKALRDQFEALASQSRAPVPKA